MSHKKTDGITPAKMSIPNAIKEKPAPKRASSKVKAELKPKCSFNGGGGRRTSAPKARATSKGKTAVSLGVSPKYSYKATKSDSQDSVDDSDASVVNNAGLKRDESINGMATSTDPFKKERNGQLSKSNLKRKNGESDSDDPIPYKKKKDSHDTSNLIHAQSRRGRGKAKPNYAVDGSSDSECSSESESESDVEDESY